MSKILKKIRRKLITGQNIDGEPANNKLYLKYAIGEIILVVLGILIALQINTWNELRKYKKLEKDMLTEIQSSLKESLLEINRMITHNEDILKSSEYVLKHLNSNLPYNDSLKYYIAPIIAWASPHFNYSAYETLKNRGLEIISNDKLKKNISIMYEKWLAFLVNDYDKYSWNYNSSVISPFFSKHFETSTSADLITATPNDYKALKKNPEFKNILKFSMLLKSMGNKEIVNTKIKLESLILSLEKEIKFIKN